MSANQQIDFLSENASRRYPFVEDCSMLSQSASFELPDDALLDCRGFTREKAVGVSLFLRAIAGAGVSTIEGEAAQPDAWTVIFQSTYGDKFCFHIPYLEIENNGKWSGIAMNALPFFGALKSSLSIAVGPGIKSVGHTDTHLFSAETAPIEPALFLSIAGSSIDSVGVLKASSGATQRLYGHVYLSGGYNVDVQNLYSNNSIQIVADPGAGALGRFLRRSNDNEQGAPQSLCESSVKAINGIIPDSLGNFTIEAGDHISIENSPSLHRIVITESVSTFLTGKNECPEAKSI